MCGRYEVCRLLVDRLVSSGGKLSFGFHYLTLQSPQSPSYFVSRAHVQSVQFLLKGDVICLGRMVSFISKNLNIS